MSNINLNVSGGQGQYPIDFESPKLTNNSVFSIISKFYTENENEFKNQLSDVSSLREEYKFQNKNWTSASLDQEKVLEQQKGFETRFNSIKRTNEKLLGFQSQITKSVDYLTRTAYSEDVKESLRRENPKLLKSVVEKEDRRNSDLNKLKLTKQLVENYVSSFKDRIQATQYDKSTYDNNIQSKYFPNQSTSYNPLNLLANWNTTPSTPPIEKKS